MSCRRQASFQDILALTERLYMNASRHADMFQRCPDINGLPACHKQVHNVMIKATSAVTTTVLGQVGLRSDSAPSVRQPHR